MEEVWNPVGIQSKNQDRLETLHLNYYWPGFPLTVWNTLKSSDGLTELYQTDMLSYVLAEMSDPFSS